MSTKVAKLDGKRAIPRAKIDLYLLNPDHPDGASKAKFFSSLGFDRSEAQVLIDALHRHAEDRHIDQEVVTLFGRKTTLKCRIETPDGRNPCVLAVWVRDDVSGDQNFVTACPTQDPSRRDRP